RPVNGVRADRRSCVSCARRRQSGQRRGLSQRSGSGRPDRAISSAAVPRRHHERRQPRTTNDRGRLDGAMELPCRELPGELSRHMEAIARGEKPLPTAEGNRHHFVPEFVLRRFVGRSEKGRKLFVLDKATGAVTESTPKQTGWQHRLYAIDSI